MPFQYLFDGGPCFNGARVPGIKGISSNNDPVLFALNQSGCPPRPTVLHFGAWPRDMIGNLGGDISPPSDLLAPNFIGYQMTVSKPNLITKVNCDAPSPDWLHSDRSLTLHMGRTLSRDKLCASPTASVIVQGQVIGMFSLMKI